MYNGNVAHTTELVDKFFTKYQHHIHTAPAQAIQAIAWQDIKHAITHGASTAGGLDAWTKQDLRWVSDLGLQWLAKCYHSIEQHQHWPSSMTKARAAFLNKDPDDAGNPMAYRILKITSVLYRLWGSVRLKNLESWITSWADPAMFAGVPGAGAEEGWYTTQLDMETYVGAA